jgi:hypothetical protein
MVLGAPRNNDERKPLKSGHRISVKLYLPPMILQMVLAALSSPNLATNPVSYGVFHQILTTTL